MAVKKKRSRLHKIRQVVPSSSDRSVVYLNLTVPSSNGGIISVIIISLVICALCPYRVPSWNTQEPTIYSNNDAQSLYNTLLMSLPKHNKYVSFDEGENVVMPDFEPVRPKKIKKKRPKKASRSTIQKIIKKPKTRIKKTNDDNDVITSAPTQPSEVYIDRNSKDQEDATSETLPTQPPMKKKKRRKPMRYKPYQKFNSRKERTKNGRWKRDINRSDVYILQDLDEIEFLNNSNDDAGNDNNVILAHVKKYW